MGGSDSSVYLASYGSLRLRANIRNALNTVTGLWPRTGEDLPLQWSEVPLWVKQMDVTTFKTELSKKNITLSESVDKSFPRNHPSRFKHSFIIGSMYFFCYVDTDHVCRRINNDGLKQQRIIKIGKAIAKDDIDMDGK